MPTFFARLTTTAALFAAIVGCSSTSNRAKPAAPAALTDGYSCFREQINPVGAVSNTYYCVFALEEASSYYSESARTERLHSFISGLGRACSIGKSWEMEDPRRTHEHDLAMIVTAVRCE
jgi:hypothetical protein